MLSLILLSVTFLLENTLSIDNGLGINPPMGWRSWNCYHGNINQSLIGRVVDSMVDRSRQVNGKPASYYDIGYTEVGVDDNWQFCLPNGSMPHHYWHNDTAPNGWPIINTQLFPDLKGLVSYAHSKKVGLGWYMNNCICKETNVSYPANEVNDVSFLREYDFDGIKLDGCGSSHNISNWQHLINTTGNKPLLTENCGNQPNHANLSWCPMNFFRSSGDINPNFPTIMRNLQSTLPFSKYPGPAITRQGCFAYPDMLEVGNIPPQYNATQYSMDRTHFGAWCVVSAPLIIGYDVTDSKITDRVWDILTNTEALAVSQTWAGHPGTLLSASWTKIYYKYPEDVKQRIKRDNMKYSHVENIRKESIEGVYLADRQIWGKPQPNGAWCILMLNANGNSTVDLRLNFTVIPGLNPTNVKLRSIWDKKDLGTFSNYYIAKNVLPFDSAFLMVTPS